MNEDEHLAWAKQRALAHLDRGEKSIAVHSMMSDLSKHSEPHESMGDAPSMLFSMLTTEDIRRWIESFHPAAPEEHP